MKDFFYCLIFPHPNNNHRARFLHPKIIFFAVSFFILSALFFSSDLSPFSKRISAFAQISAQELVDFTNQKRKENGLPALSSSPELSQAASKKADDMFAKNYWAHNSPDGTTPWIFIKQAGYNYTYAGENLARGFNSSWDVVNAWMASTNHRANILSPNFSDVGFSVKSGKLSGEETFLVVQELGSRRVLPAAKTTKKAKQIGTKKVLGFAFSPNFINKPNFSTSSEIAIILITIFIAIFIVDLVMIKRKKVVRFVGHNLDHALFLIVVICVITIFNTGSVL